MPLPPRALRRLRGPAAALCCLVLVELGLALAPSWFARPDLVALPPDDAGRWLRTQPLERQAHEAFWYGEELGARLPLEVALARASSLDLGLRMHTVDGIGHGLAWDGPLSAQLDAVEATVPTGWRRLFFDSVVRAAAERHAGDPAPVLAATLAVLERDPGFDGRQGARVGLQRARGDDLPTAIALALRYPAPWQPTMLEELGWRFGNDGLPADALTPLVSTLPPPLACSVVRGAVRGAAMAAHWGEESGGQLLQLALAGGEACLPEARQGAENGIVLRFGHTPGAVDRARGVLPVQLQRRPRG